ncbi:hypothetical protein SNEBB_009700 [Seison nebaliae]|nr:hypothetical protein SNEBB_009700 [Seison nebaliae]
MKRVHCNQPHYSSCISLNSSIISSTIRRKSENLKSSISNKNSSNDLKKLEILKNSVMKRTSSFTINNYPSQYHSGYCCCCCIKRKNYLQIKKKKKFISTSFFLISLAICDTLVLYVTPIRRLLKYAFHYDLRDHYKWYCRLSKCFDYTVSSTSFWLLAIICIDRLWALKKQQQHSKYVTMKSSLIILFVLIGSEFLLHSHYLYFYAYWEHNNGTSILLCDPLPQQITYVFYYNHVHQWLGFTLNMIIPLIILIVGSIFIIRVIILNKRNLNKLCEQDVNNWQRDRNKREITKMLLATIIVFIISVLPRYVDRAYFDQISTSSDFDGALFDAVSSTLLYVQHSINFYIFLIFNHSIRAQFLILYNCSNCFHKEINS